ncbi:hypothetical protein TSUD_348550 [Trifolium subterraneum]|uniref:pectinesterase n=1 Tax=Trifolium subterraneum TaxID=3900 RepID=A0A2Z6NEY1_TRISU|nr:hypothetical protein TSUD_348550 [Trifolium subterraneum]
MKSLQSFAFFLIFVVLAFDICESKDCSNPFKTIVVSQSDTSNFTTIQSAIDSVPTGNSQWIHIQISPGVYREQVFIPKDKPCIYVEGAGRNSTSIEWSSHLNATFVTKANNTVANGITFTASTIFFSMGKYGPKKNGVITAHERDSPNDTSGFVFKNCNISGTGGKTQLGRAMGPYARVIISDSYLSDVVRPEGWGPREFVGHEGNLTFVEEGNRGPGADKSKRVNWMKHLSGSELDKFLNISYIDEEGWISELPKTIFI